MKSYPSVLTPQQAKALSEEEEGEIFDAIKRLNDALSNYDGHPIEVDLQESTLRVREFILDKIRESGWMISGNNVATTSSGGYRAPSYNGAPGVDLTLSEPAK